MARPRKDKKFDPKKHHAPNETHKLTQTDYVVLAQIEEAIGQLQNAKANLLAGVAVTKWGYPTGQVLEFIPNFNDATVNVIMKGQVKEVPSTTQE